MMRFWQHDNDNNHHDILYTHTYRKAVPLRAVSKALTDKWSLELLRESRKPTELSSICTVAQLYFNRGGWGKIKRDNVEGVKLLLKASTSSLQARRLLAAVTPRFREAGTFGRSPSAAAAVAVLMTNSSRPGCASLSKKQLVQMDLSPNIYDTEDATSVLQTPPHVLAKRATSQDDLLGDSGDGDSGGSGGGNSAISQTEVKVNDL
jgi:hypothetical protein